MRALRRGVAALLVAAGVAVAPEPVRADGAAWSPAELRVLRSLWIGSLPPVPDDPSNAYDTDPRAAAFGERLFSDVRLSKNGALSCASCHPPAHGFQDTRPTAVGLGPLPRRSMTLLGVGYNTWFFWDGRKDSLWAQATTPIENPLELGMPRAEVVRAVAAHHRDEYVAIFGALPEEPASEAAATRVLANVGKAIAAFVRTIVPGPARFDRFVAGEIGAAPRDASAALTPAELRGLRLFIGDAHCTNCHAGPLFTNGEFHFTRVPQAVPDAGRSAGIALVRGDEFNCTGAFSDAKPDECRALRFMDADTRETLRAFKTPTLRNVAARAPYMNAGQLPTLSAVLRFYREQSRGMKELAHGHLRDEDLTDLEAFLGTLTGPVIAHSRDG